MLTKETERKKREFRNVLSPRVSSHISNFHLYLNTPYAFNLFKKIHIAKRDLQRDLKFNVYICFGGGNEIYTCIFQ